MTRKKKLKKELKKQMLIEKERKMTEYSKNNVSMVLLKVNKQTQNPIVFIAILKYLISNMDLWKRENGCISLYEVDVEKKGLKIGPLLLFTEQLLEKFSRQHPGLQKWTKYKDHNDLKREALEVINRIISARFGIKRDIFDVERKYGHFAITELEGKSDNEVKEILVDILESAISELATKAVKLDEYSADIRYIESTDNEETIWDGHL